MSNSSVCSTSTSILCTHCGSPVLGIDSLFCCRGCQAAHEVLNSLGLGRYYDLASAQGFRPKQPITQVEESTASYDDLDDPTVRAAYGVASERPTLDFFLEGVECSACLWVIETLPEKLEGVVSIRVHLGDSTARVTLKEGGKFAPVCRILDRLGYKPRALRDASDREKIEDRENRTTLWRMGVAALCAANIMLFSLALYAGAKGPWIPYFGWAILGFAVPPYTYSAAPLYKNAWNSLKNGKISIDLPIVMALLLGFGSSVYHVVHGSDEVYLDSLTSLIFLLLASRYFLKKLHQKALRGTRLIHTIAPRKLLKVQADGTQIGLIWSQDIALGDFIEVPAGVTLPIDGIIRSGSSEMNLALLSGESAPVTVGIGDSVFSGTQNLENPLRIEVTAIGSQTRLGRILAQIEAIDPSRAPIAQAADQAAKWFLMAVVVLATIFVITHWNTDPAEGIRRALSLLIVACPCALALATPLTLARGYTIAAREGILIKNPAVLEEIARIRKIFLDKTGTLTEGHPRVVAENRISDSLEISALILSVAQGSRHPLSKAIVRHLIGEKIEASNGSFDSYREIPGQGIEAEKGGVQYRLGRMANTEIPAGNAGDADSRSWVGFYRDGQLLRSYALEDEIRTESLLAIESIRAMNIDLSILSGDRTPVVHHVAKILGIPADNAFGEMTPEKKAEILEHDPSAMMVGDGANDALALSRSLVGVAVHGSLDVSLRAAQVHISTPGIAGVRRMIEIGKETRKVLMRNFALSIAYNAVSASLAAIGLIHPLIAAIIMPISAMTVFASSQIGTKRLRGAERRNS